MRRLILPLTLVMAVACKPPATLPSDTDVAAEQAAIRQVDSGIVAAGNAHDIDAFLAFFADDARMLPPGAPPVVGSNAIRVFSPRSGHRSSQWRTT